MFTTLAKSDEKKDVEEKHDHLEMMLNEIEGTRRRRRRDIEEEEHLSRFLFLSLSLSLSLSLFSFLLSSSNGRKQELEEEGDKLPSFFEHF